MKGLTTELLDITVGDFVQGGLCPGFGKKHRQSISQSINQGLPK